ncbi:peptidoglycan-binding protein [Patescibacteria group bacterium]|nr:peptidoglycan-binding protein [Patescibacteria group bacterium]MBU1500440.1 peptidoglycan-binding protein [Patescibacteria group bacterium]MBU2080508.1 peptidoglycan-binding protein [Patescibacteria group bacterium]MBU2123687.1 peptidoglycan-binding protein [Patescibacteria group bacterium]MBU2194543.1 peptidoglycan-binding protein [Patescibacteria group bacterium]
MNTLVYKHTIEISLIAFLALAAVLLYAPKAEAATCVFSTTNLEMGSVGEDVRCLQKYLNGAGFTVSTSGVGSPGSETNQFQSKTLDAVKRWQVANGVSPFTGTWGPLSRAKYLSLTASVPTTPVPTTPTVPTTPVVNTQEKSARTALQNVRDNYEDAQEDYEDAKDDGDSLGKSKTYLAEALEDLLKGLYAFIDQDYAKAVSHAKNAESLVDDAQDELGGSKGDKEDAKEAIEDADEAYDDAKDEINDADDDGDDVDKARNILADAKEALKDAEDEYDDGDYNSALEYAKDASALIKKALKAL